MTAMTVLLGALSSLICLQGIACSCGTSTPISERLLRSPEVFVASIESAEYSPSEMTEKMRADYERFGADVLLHVFHEAVVLRVDEVFKGSAYVGQRIRVESDVSPGDCSTSMTNRGGDLVNINVGTGVAAPVVFSAWIIFANSVSDTAASLCGWSVSIEQDDQEPIEELRRALQNAALEP